MTRRDLATDDAAAARLAQTLGDQTLVDQLDRLARQRGLEPNADPIEQPLVGLYQLTGPLVYPDGTDPSEPDVPYTQGAKLVWLNHATNQYGGTAYSTGVTLYHPTTYRDDAGLPLGTPTLCAGMRCHAWYSRQSGRWEILEPALNIVRIELAATLLPGDSSVAALLVDHPEEPQLTVHVNAADSPGVGRAGSGPYNHAGTLGHAIFSPVRARWELLDLSAKLIAEGKADAAIDTGSSGVVSLWWKDYATGDLVDSGQDVAALNWLWPNVAAGDKVIVAYDRQENRWTILAAQ